MRHYPLFLLLWLLPAAASATDKVMMEVQDGKSFTLTSRDVVKLASIEGPEAEEPLAKEAKAALAALLAGHALRIDYVMAGKDRHNRLIGQVYRDDGMWIEEQMLKDGWAMVRSYPEDKPGDIVRMLAAEGEARQAKRGIWAEPYFRVLSPADTGNFIGKFKLVEGKVITVHAYHGNLYINFSERWKGNFSVFIGRKYLPAFGVMDLSAFAGKTLRVRGWIEYHNAPAIDVTHPAQIEAP